MTRSTTQYERAIETAMRPGDFIDDDETWDFVEGVEEVAAEIKKLIRKGQAAQAVALFETFIAAAYEKADEVDDSSGSFGLFAESLFCDWVRARQAAKAKPEDTAHLLADWIDNDDYGFCNGLEEQLSKVLNKRGLRAFAAEARTRLDASAPDDRGRAGYPRRCWTAVLKRILAAQDDAEAYLALAQETTVAAEDCNVVAGIHERCGNLGEALAWVERGLALTSEDDYSLVEHELKEQQRELLARLGRVDKAVASAWADFERSPGKYSYEALIETVPATARNTWHEKALAAAGNGDLWSVVGLFVETNAIEHLAARVDSATDDELEGLSHHAAEPAAELLAQAHPAIAARMFRALGLRVVKAKKSKYYQAALANLERARDCYLAAGQRAGWDALVKKIRRDHARKSRFMPGFERVAAGGPAAEPSPSFLDRARSRWPPGGR